MRTLLLSFSILITTAVSAQISPFQGLNGFQSNNKQLSKKWSLTKYAGLSTGVGFWGGTRTGMFSAPVGLQLNRLLTNNLYGFAGVSAAPTYFSAFRLSPTMPLTTGHLNTFQFNQSSIYTRAELGLMYVNDQKTFSISGSIGVQRAAYPAYMIPPASHPGKTNPLNTPR